MEGGYSGPVPAVGQCTDSRVVVLNETLSRKQLSTVTDVLLLYHCILLFSRFDTFSFSQVRPL